MSLKGVSTGDIDFGRPFPRLWRGGYRASFEWVWVRDAPGETSWAAREAVVLGTLDVLYQGKVLHWESRGFVLGVFETERRGGTGEREGERDKLGWGRQVQNELHGG